ncbi:Inositol-pentakisphosphate 2-kinase [Cymbomonas tetramitiformis]|uniref:inositol-pentakisphosphate 2-kinase n=1 Tax=Cymbomonas tetramitiformis TaxID=36881 RepID=A0AAE0FW49_9CHLO|nr:Inositol-pentakisphosphate 2-kinase [Cymbomonas tetramitiformis]
MERLKVEEWTYRAEGAASVVFAYSGPSDFLSGKVLRVRKSKKVRCSDASEANSSLSDDHIWNTVPGMELSGGRTSDDRLEVYMQRVLRPLLGNRLVSSAQAIATSDDFISELNTKYQHSERVGSLPLSSLDIQCGKSLLLPDHALFYSHSHLETPAPSASSSLPSKTDFRQDLAAMQRTICVEIKPKCGFLPECLPACAPEVEGLKCTYTRFAMHQELKRLQNKVQILSEYCPLDFFSGEPARMYKAVQALIRSPQNNLRVLLDTQPILPSGPQHTESGERVLARHLGEGFSPVTCGEERVAALIEMVVTTILSEGALTGLLEAQKLDTHSIEGIMEAYQRLLANYTFHSKASHYESNYVDSTASSVTKSCSYEAQTRTSTTTIQGGCRSRQTSSSCQHTVALSALQSASPDDCMEAVRQFLVSATAKDCALMITLQPSANPGAMQGRTVSPNTVKHEGNIITAGLQQSLRPETSTLRYLEAPARVRPSATLTAEAARRCCCRGGLAVAPWPLRQLGAAAIFTALLGQHAAEGCSMLSAAGAARRGGCSSALLGQHAAVSRNTLLVRQHAAKGCKQLSVAGAARRNGLHLSAAGAARRLGLQLSAVERHSTPPRVAAQRCWDSTPLRAAPQRCLGSTPPRAAPQRC